MALHKNLSIYRTACDLLNATAEITRNIPRAYKWHYAKEISSVCAGMMVRIRRANMAENKIPHLNQLLEDIEVAEVLLRMFTESQWISPAQYALGIELTNSVGAQAGGWKNSCIASPASRPSRRT